MMNIKLLLSISLSLLIASCTQENNKQSLGKKINQAGAKQMMKKQEQQWQQVTVKYFDFEGGFYGLLADNGEKYLPMNLSKEYKVEGTVLKVKGHVIKGMMTTTQWGEPFEVSDILLITLGKDRLGKKTLGETF